MARPKRQPNSPETRDKILQAARIEFAESGIAVSLEAIAKRCDIKRPSLLHHFPSKRALIAAVTDDILQKARLRILDALADGKGDYVSTMRAVMSVLKNLEREERGVAGMLLHTMLSSESGAEVTERLSELIEIIHSTAVIAGANGQLPANEMKAAIAQLVMGEIARSALGSQAESIWGPADGVAPLFDAFFLDANS